MDALSEGDCAAPAELHCPRGRRELCDDLPAGPLGPARGFDLRFERVERIDDFRATAVGRYEDGTPFTLEVLLRGGDWQVCESDGSVSAG